MIWVIVMWIVVLGALTYLVVLGASKVDKEDDEGELEEWFRENMREEGYEALYEEIKAEDVPAGFEDLL